MQPTCGGGHLAVDPGNLPAGKGSHISPWSARISDRHDISRALPGGGTPALHGTQDARLYAPGLLRRLIGARRSRPHRVRERIALVLILEPLEFDQDCLLFRR